MEILFAHRPGFTPVTSRGRIHALILGVVVCVLASHPAAAAPPPERKPFFDARSHTTHYAGPDDAPSSGAQVREVRIGYFGPSDPADPRGGDAWRGACRAVHEANANGGWHGKPFRLVPVWSANPWGSGVKDVTRLAYQQHVWAIIGGIDGPTTHLAEQVVAKARLPLVSPLCTDKTVNMANVPWMFSLAPNDARVADVLSHAIVRRAGRQRLVLVTATRHDAHVAAVELRKMFTRLEIAVELQLEFNATDGDPRVLATQCVAVKPRAIVLLAGPIESARLVTELRGVQYAGPIFGGPAMARRAFREQAGPAAEGVIFPRLIEWARDAAANPDENTSIPRLAGRTATNQELRTLDYTASLTYDATWLVMQAIRRGGLSRAEIGRQLRQIVPCVGQSGLIAWDGLGSNTRRPTLATLHDGRTIPLVQSEFGRE